MAAKVKKGELLRQRIVAEATRLFAAQGLRGTSVQEIADAVEISKQRLLYHFPSKEQLHQAVVEAIAEQWKDLLPGLLGAGVKADGEVGQSLSPLFDFLRAQPDAAKYIIRDLISEPREAVDQLGILVWPWMEHMAETIRRGQQDQEIDADLEPMPFMVLVGLLALVQVVVFPPGKDPGPGGDELQQSVQREFDRLLKARLQPK